MEQKNSRTKLAKARSSKTTFIEGGMKNPEKKNRSLKAVYQGGKTDKTCKSESLISMVWRCRKDLKACPGQGTTEYAILVGVLVVIAILAITVFRPKLQELWDAISSGINSL